MLKEYRMYDKGTFLISVNRYEKGEMQGAFYHPLRREGGTFQSLIQLLLQMGRSMDRENLPQSFQSPRSFTPLGSLWTGGDACRFLTGREATFAVTVKFRRHSSWQGELLCRGDVHPRPFRSVLELIGLMEGAMESRLREDA